MASELFSVFAMTSSWAAGGYTDYATPADAHTSGSMLLTSSIWNGYATDNCIRIPKGCAFKVWESKMVAVTAAPEYVHIQYKNTSGGVWTTIETDSADVMGKEQRTARSGRPLVIESHDGEMFVQFLFQNSANSEVTLASYNCEIVELNVD